MSHKTTKVGIGRCKVEIVSGGEWQDAEGGDFCAAPEKMYA